MDNELQNLVPNLLLAILSAIWSDRQDWFFGVDMGIYYLPTAPRKSIVPDERIEQAKLALQNLRYRLQQRGIDPDNL